MSTLTSCTEMLTITNALMDEVIEHLMRAKDLYHLSLGRSQHEVHS